MTDLEIDTAEARLRSGQACLGCRRRKSRCDAVRPKCSYCKKRKLDCQYASFNRAKEPSSQDSSYIASLEDRLRRLEQDLLLQNETSSLKDVQHTRARGNEKGTHDQNGGDVQEIEDDIEFSSDSELQVQVLPESLDSVEYDEASVEIVIADFGLSPYTISASQKKRKRSSSSARRQGIKKPGGVIRGRNELDQDNFRLPDYQCASKLVNLFFEYVFPLYPFVHKPTFMTRFERLYRHRPKPAVQADADIAWQATLNFVFAFGCDYLDSPLAESHHMSQNFHRRGSELILSICFDTSTLDVLQALLLLSGHIQSNMKYNRLWTSMGCLVRSAQGLGLHMDPANWEIGSIEKEMRKRVWWGIYMLDRFCSLKNGRPPATTLQIDPVGPPAAIEDEFLTESPIPNGKCTSATSPLHFFNSMVQLAHITETMLSSMFKEISWCLPWQASSRTSRREKAEHDIPSLYVQLELVAEQEGRLAVWLSGLPEMLRWDKEAPSNGQQKILYIRYLYTRLMSHRPNFLSVVELDLKNFQSLGDSYLQSTIMASVRQSIQCATDIITEIKVFGPSKVIGPWWYNMQFIYTALGTLFAVQSRPGILDYVDQSTVKSSIDMGLDYLEQLGDINPVISRCRTYFIRLQKWARAKQARREAAILRASETTNSPPIGTTNFQLQGSNNMMMHIEDQNTELNIMNQTLRLESDTSPSVFDANFDPLSEIFLEPLLPDLNLEYFQ